MSQVRGHDKTYEWKATLILSLAFGLVGLDRFILPSLFFGHIDVDLGLNEGHLGQIVGVLAVAWGISAVLFGGLSDRLGRRNVLVPAVIFFSLMSWASGAVTGLVSLLLVRALMGVAEGAVAPTGVAAVVEASHPNRRGINNGFFQCAIALFGLAIAPIMATQLLQYMSWRWVFLIAGIPGLIVALFLWKIIREPHQLATSVAESAAAPKPPLASIFRHRNIVVSMLSLMCAMMGIFILAAFMPGYLTNFLGLEITSMGFVTSAIGFGGALGQFAIPAVSDFLGRRLATVLSFIGSAVFLYFFIQTGAGNNTQLFVLLFGAALFNFGALAILAGPIPAEAAPPGLIATAAGLVIGVGEIFGGGVAPAIAGAIASARGLDKPLMLTLGALLVGIVISLFLKETAPRKIR